MQPHNLPSDLAVARYRFGFLLHQAVQFPAYAGSTLRGIFGHALMKYICTCRQDPHQDNCFYSRVFSVPPSQRLDRSQRNTPPPPYVIEPPLQGKTHWQSGEIYRFNLVLIGEARHYLPLISYALQQAFNHQIGRQKSRAELIELAVEHQDSWHPILKDRNIIRHHNSISLLESYPEHICLNFLTPVRLQQQGKVVKEEHFSADQVLRQAMRRSSSIAQLYFPQAIEADYAALARQCQDVVWQSQVRWQDWTRYSNRQQQHMNLGGLIGECRFEDIPPELSVFLHLCQWLHIGKETVFGLGAYRLRKLAND